MKHICQALRVPGQFIDEYLHIGSGTLEGDVVINISKTKQDPAAFYRGVYGNATIGLSGNSATAIAEGGRLEGKITSGFNLTSTDYGLRGGTFVATHSGTGTVSLAVGGLSLIQNHNVGTVTTGFSHIIASGDNSGGGTLTNLVGLAVANQSLGTNNTLLLMGTLTPLTSNYAIYSASTYQSLFAGNITANAIITANRQNIQTTTTQGMAVRNDEVSTVGVQTQYSPGLDFIGHGWRTSASQDRYCRFRFQLEPTAGTPTSALTLRSSTDTGTESFGSALFTFAHSGTFSATNLLASALTSGRVPVVSTGGLLVDFSTFTSDGAKITLSTTGSSGGFSIGGDVNFYRNDANEGKTDDSLVVGQAISTGVVTLTDGATPALDASLGNTFLLTAAGNRTIAVPTNPKSGQKITIVHKASGADRTLALNTGAGGFRFGTDITALTATTSAKTDYIGCIYNAADSFWDILAYRKGY